jgi:pimeloyl-ACP methyl ester carboxylesterase
MFEWYRDRAAQTLNAIQQPRWTINSADYVGTNVDQLQALVPGIEVRILDGVGHFLMLEAPAAFNRTLDEVLTRILGS